MAEGMTIRSLETAEEHLMMEELQAEVWCREEVVPVNQTFTAVKNGGIALGLFDGDALVGICYGFPGYKDEMVYLCSHMLALREKYRSGGWGKKLKMAQMKEALRLGYDKMTWTYDPLESPNARLNIGKLRAVVKTYLPNCYGEMPSPLNAGLPSDRFLAEWYITSPRVIAPRNIKVTNDVKLGGQVIFKDGVPELTKVDLDITDEELLFPIPRDFQAIRKSNHEVALAWRLKSREFFETYFAEGYAVTDFEVGEELNYYLLQKYK